MGRGLDELMWIKEGFMGRGRERMNYLRATPYEVGLLLNFGPKPKHIRQVYENSGKTRTWTS